MKIRPAASMLGLDESMQQIREVANKSELMEYLKDRFDYWNPTEENVTIEFYSHDKRINWNTHLICIDGKAALFSDSNF